jgi:GAF domain-containing protein
VELGNQDRLAPEYLEALRQIQVAQETDVLETALAAARQQLSMDAAYVTTIDSTHQTIEALLGEMQALAQLQGVPIPLEQTYCMRMLKGEIPNVIPDTRADPSLRNLSATREIGAYVGFPVRLSDGRVRGTLCCVSKEPRLGLGEKDAHFMQVLAEIVAARLEQVEGDMARLTERFRSRPPAG